MRGLGSCTETPACRALDAEGAAFGFQLAPTKNCGKGELPKSTVKPLGHGRTTIPGPNEGVYPGIELPGKDMGRNEVQPTLFLQMRLTQAVAQVALMLSAEILRRSDKSRMSGRTPHANHSTIRKQPVCERNWLHYEFAEEALRLLR